MKDSYRNAEWSCVNKVRFKSQEAAEAAYQRYKDSLPRSKGRWAVVNKLKQRPYRCRHCNGWHLSRV